MTYGLEDDWQYVDNVVDAVFSFGPDRSTDQEPGEFCKVLVANPKHSLGEGVRLVDVVITVWSETLVDASGELIIPDENDRFTIGNEIFIIVSSGPAVFNCQWVLNCRRQPSSGGPR